MPANATDRALSPRLVENYIGAMRAWAASMTVDRALEAVFFERIGSSAAEHAAMGPMDRHVVNSRYKRWQAQCGITEAQTPQERMALALANDEPVVAYPPMEDAS